MSSTLREIRDIFVSSVMRPRFWGVFIAIIILFALVGPFGTFDRMDLPMRFAYWSVTMLGSWLIAMVMISVVVGTFLKTVGKPFLLMILATALASIPITAFVQMTIPLFVSQQVDIGFWQQFAYTLPISVLFGTLVSFVIVDDLQGEGEVQTSDDNALMKRLPIGARGPVKHMSMQDHYVEVTTTRGRELVLMRMADAVAALSSESGLQVHRSHWINKTFVSNSRRENGQPIVVMDDGTEYPVSRSFVKTARDAGII